MSRIYARHKMHFMYVSDNITSFRRRAGQEMEQDIKIVRLAKVGLNAKILFIMILLL